MSVPFSGTFTRSGGVASAIGKQLKRVNLKPVKRMVVAFDPFHCRATSTRDFLFHVSSPRVLSTNQSCAVRTEVLCDRSEPSVKLELGNGDRVVIRGANLTTLEILQLYNRHVTPLAPVESKAAKTKSEKAGVKARRR